MGQKGGSKADKQNKKRKKTGAAASSSSTSPSPSPPPAPAPPPRVSNQINVPIRRQIRYGKINKQFREGGLASGSFRQTSKGTIVNAASNPVKRTAYRKQLDEQTIQEKALERQRRGQNPDWSVVLNQTKADPLVLVDGYNVIYKWPRLKKHMVRGDTERARQLLLDDLEGLASLRKWRIECVFDGAGRAAIVGPLGSNSNSANNNNNDVGKNPTTTPFGNTGTVRTVFTGKGIEADTYIEGRCAAAKNTTLGLTTSSLIVATDDSQIKLVAASSGALCMSSDRFVLELKAVKKGMQFRVEQAMSEINNTPLRPESQWGTASSSNKMIAPGERFFQGSSGDYRTKPKREVLEEHADGSKTIMARYGANEVLIKDNRNKKKTPKPLASIKKKKKKKKKK